MDPLILLLLLHVLSGCSNAAEGRTP
jgi:predicted small secreted protein